mgnify:CR=1 FL=1
MCDDGDEDYTDAPTNSHPQPAHDYAAQSGAAHDYAAHAGAAHDYAAQSGAAHDYAAHAGAAGPWSQAVYAPCAETHGLLAEPMAGYFSEQSEGGRGWYLTCPSIGVDVGSVSRCLIPCAVLCLLLGVWIQSDRWVLLGCGLCLLATAFCVPLSSVFLGLAVIVFIWTSFGRKAYDIIRFSVNVNNTASMLHRSDI